MRTEEENMVVFRSLGEKVKGGHDCPGLELQELFLFGSGSGCGLNFGSRFESGLL
jgi:hypothetical protein